jgi:antitoxin component YwqK of YwqJK toxin-antitoxin module
MTFIKGKLVEYWIEENHPENGVFKAYWKNVIDNCEGGITLDPNENEGIRYEWYYKNNKRADGISKGWYSNGQLKEIMNWKNNCPHGLVTYWYEDGQKWYESTNKDGKFDGLFTYWHKNGQKWKEGTFKNDKPVGLWTYWNQNGQKQFEGAFKNWEWNGLLTRHNKNGKLWSEEKIYENGKLVSEKE